MNSIIEVLKNTSFYDGDKNSLSASSMTKDILQLWFELNEYEKEEKLSDATLGSIVHIGMEKIILDWFQAENKTDFSIEQRLTKDFYGELISGKPDLVVDNVIWDYKTGKNYSRKQFLKEGKKHAYSIQLSIYNWLLGGEHDAKILWLMKDSKAIDGEPVFIEDDVELMSKDEIENYMANKIIELEKYDKDTLPPECSDLWLRKVKGTVIKMKCKLYCGYKNVCPYFKETAKQSVSTW